MFNLQLQSKQFPRRVITKGNENFRHQHAILSLWQTKIQDFFFSTSIIKAMQIMFLEKEDFSAMVRRIKQPCNTRNYHQNQT
jgi:hypothetical protein